MSDIYVAGGLTARDVEVLRYIASGFSEKEIASHMGIRRGSVARRIEFIRKRSGITQVGTKRPLFLLAWKLGCKPIVPEEGDAAFHYCP